MIEIIKRGTKHIAVCNECGCKFRYDDEDVKSEHDNEYTYIYDMTKAYINCPQCNAKVVIKQTKQPTIGDQNMFLRGEGEWPKHEVTCE